jgi:hypothetical protein
MKKILWIGIAIAVILISYSLWHKNSKISTKHELWGNPEPIPPHVCSIEPPIVIYRTDTIYRADTIIETISIVDTVLAGTVTRTAIKYDTIYLPIPVINNGPHFGHAVVELYLRGPHREKYFHCYSCNKEFSLRDLK